VKAFNITETKSGRHRDARHLGPPFHRLDLLPRPERLRDRANGEAREPRRGDGPPVERRSRRARSLAVAQGSGGVGIAATARRSLGRSISAPVSAATMWDESVGPSRLPQATSL
jgi:hypothetical protein